MNKFFAIILLSFTAHLLGMNTDLYSHDYQCKRHHHKGPYPYLIPMNRITKELLSKGEYSGFWVREGEDRAYDQFEDGKAPLVIARKTFNKNQAQELESLKQQALQASRALFNILGRPIGVEERDTTPWRNLRTRLANPPADQIAWWIGRLNEQPELWKAIEKAALTANIFGSKKPDYFKNLLLPIIAKGLDAVFYAQSTSYVEQLDLKNQAINQERRAKEVAELQAQNERAERQRINDLFIAEHNTREHIERDFNDERAAKEAALAQVTAHQQATNANVAALRELEPTKSNSLNLLAQKASETVYNEQSIRFDSTDMRRIIERRNNPPAEQLQAHTLMLSTAQLDPLYNLVIKKAQVEPENAKALLIDILATLHFATSDMHKHIFDAECSRLTQEKIALEQHVDDNLRQIRHQEEQRHRQASATLQNITRELSPLRRELPSLRDRVKEQDIQIKELRNALAARNHQTP